MKLIISPAKSLDFTAKVAVTQYSVPFFKKEASELNAILKEFSPDELVKLLKISDKLATLNWGRNMEFSETNELGKSRQAVYAFSGDVYQGLDIYSLNKTQVVEVLQERLVILSGLYGLLKPLDLIQPYRLEMGIQLKNSKGKNLYEFWGDQITEKLNQMMGKDDVLVNLASSEYFKAINTSKLKSKIVTPEFKDYKNGKLKVISFFAKKARGMFVRFVVENEIKTESDLKYFDAEGYRFDALLSTKNKLVFTR